MIQIPSPKAVPGSSLDARYVAWAKAGNTSGGTKGRHARIVADYIRHALCQLAAENGMAGAVHIQRLLTAVRTQLGWLIPPMDEPPWAEHDGSPDDEHTTPSKQVKSLFLLMLERLILLGDCCKRGEGYYLPAPVRRVVLSSGESIIVGGMGTNALARMSGAEIGWAGLARTLGQSSWEVPSQNVQQWLGLPREALSEWTRQVFHRANESLKKSPGLDGSEFEIYSPHTFRGRGQSNRWSLPRQWTPPQASASSLPALNLCRTRRRPRRFWLAPLESVSGEVGFCAETVVPRAEARRFMYGIDQYMGAPTRAEVITQGATAVEFRVYSWLPSEEYRLFTALCYQTENAPDSPLPVTFILPARYWPDVASALRGLGIVTPDPR